jgi:nucleoside phosphorylase
MPDKHDYEVAWICLADVEFAAAQTFLSNPDLPQKNSTDDIEYVLGQVGSLHVIVVKSTSSSTFGFDETMALVTRFPNIKKYLVISSGGGAPTRKHDIRLGDVVVSRSNDGSGAIQYDYHKAMQEGILEETAHLDTPKSTAVGTSDFPGGLPQTLEPLRINRTTIYHEASIDQLDWTDSFKRPSTQADLLHKSGASVSLKHWVPMFDDDASRLVKRDPRASIPVIHYGKIASAVLPMVNGIARNFYASTESILCFETGASKIYHKLPALLICGICDYADGYTDGAWRECAAMAASACASEFTRLLDIQKIRAEVNIGEVLTRLFAALTYCHCSSS